MRRLLSIICFSLLLTSCGFRLQNREQIPPKIRTMQMTSADPYGEFERSLLRNLSFMGIKLTYHDTGAPVVLKILSTHLSHNEPTLGTTAQARNYIFTYDVAYALTDPSGKVLLGPLSVKDTQTLILNSDQLLQGNNQVQLLEQEMQRELARKLFYQLTSDEVKQALAQYSHLDILVSYP